MKHLLALVVVMLVGGAARVARADDAKAMNTLLCFVLEPTPDGGVFVSPPITLPIKDPDVDFSRRTYTVAFEKLVRARYSFDTRPLIVAPCELGTEAQIKARRELVMRRAGNKPDGKLLRTDVPWAPDAKLAEESRKQRAADRAALGGFFYCAAGNFDNGDVEVTMSPILTVPADGTRESFLPFVKVRFQYAVAAARTKANKKESMPDQVSCDYYGDVREELALARTFNVRQFSAPQGGGSFGPPDKRSMNKFTLVELPFALSESQLRDYAKFTVELDKETKRFAAALKTAWNTRRRRDCMAGKQAACGAAP